MGSNEQYSRNYALLEQYKECLGKNITKFVMYILCYIWDGTVYKECSE